MSAKLFKAITESNIDLIKKLLSEGNIDINWIHPYSGRSFLIEAVLSTDNIEILKLLVEAGININHSCKAVGYTALMFACNEYHGNIQFVKYLVESGADIELTNDAYLRTALLHTAQSLQIEVVKYLIEKGANYHYVSSDGHNCLTMAKKNNDKKLLKNKNYLIQYFKELGVVEPEPIPEPDYIDWPENLEDVTNPAAVLRSYILEMYQLEDQTYQAYKKNKDFNNWEEYQKAIMVVLEKWAKPTGKVYRQGGSVGWPYSYSEVEKLFKIETISEKKLKLYTRYDHQNGMIYDNCYQLAFVKKRWWLINKKSRPINTAPNYPWNSAIL